MGDRPVRCSLSQIMKAFILLSLAATALATPARGGRRPQRGNKKEKVDPGNILRCAAENFGNNQTIKDCIECFSAEMDFTSQSGLDAAKACGTEISAMAPGNMEKNPKAAKMLGGLLKKLGGD